MPATTARGYPYPLGTDRVADGDDSIRALAEKVDTALGAMAAGTASINHVSTGFASTTITFPVGRFTAPPTSVLVQAFGTSVGGVLEGSGTSSGISATGCTVGWYRSSGTGTMTVTWQATLV